jgi:hypothetical protein
MRSAATRRAWFVTEKVKSVQDRRVHTRLTIGVIIVIADLDTLLIALYVELTDRIIPCLGFTRHGPGKPPEVTDAELVCLAVAQVLLRYDDERRWLRAAPKQAGRLFPRLLRQSEYNERIKAAAPLMEAAVRWLADHTPGSAELLRLMDATPVPCGHSVVTARRPDLYGYAGYGFAHRWCWRFTGVQRASWCAAPAKPRVVKPGFHRPRVRWIASFTSLAPAVADRPRRLTRPKSSKTQAARGAVTLESRRRSGGMSGGAGRGGELMDEHEWLAERFEENRPHLRALAYRVLGSPTLDVAQAPAPAATTDLEHEAVLADSVGRGGDFEALLAVLDPDIALRADAIAARMDGTGEVRGAAAVAATFAGRAAGARLALIDGAPGMMWAQGGQLRVVFDPEHLAELDVVPARRSAWLSDSS